MSDNNDFTHEFQIFSTDQNAGTMGTGKFMLYDNNINALKIETIDNIKIGGGSNGRVLATDGNGNLQWISAAAVTGGVSSYNDLEDLPTLFSGNYNDLTNKPTIPTDISQLGDSTGLLGGGGGGGATDEITNTSPEGSIYSVSVSTTGIVTMTTARGSLEFGAQPEEGAPQHFHIMRPAGQEGSSDLYFGDDYNYVKLPGNYGVGTQGVEIGSAASAGNQKSWRFGTDGHLTLPAGGDIKDSSGNSVLGGGGNANTGDIVFSGGTLRNSDNNEVRLESLDINQVAYYNFTPQGGDYSTAVWDGSSITFNNPTSSIQQAIWALNNLSTVEIQINGQWQTVTYAGSYTPSLPEAQRLDINESAVGGPLNIDNVQITINQGTSSYVEIDGTDFRVDVQDDIRMYANDTFRLVNRSSEDSISIETDDGAHVWRFRSNGNLELPNGGSILDDNGNNVIPTVPTAVSQLTNDSGFVVATTVPASSVGAPGDVAGKIAFDSLYLYYCTDTFGGTQYTVLHDISSASSVNGVDQGYLVPNSYQLPQVGWKVYYNGETRTIDQVNSSGIPGYYVVFVDTALTIPGQATFAWGPASTTNIWKRVAWSADTW